MNKLLSFGVVAGMMLAASGTANAFECKVKEASMDKPGGFPERALTMIVPYGPAGGSGQVAAAMAKEVREETAARDAVCKAGVMMHLRLDQAPPVAREDGDEDGRLCAVCKQNCYFSFVAWCVLCRARLPPAS